MNFNACLSMMLSLLSQPGYIKTPPPPPKTQCFKVSKDMICQLLAWFLKGCLFRKEKLFYLDNFQVFLNSWTFSVAFKFIKFFLES